MRGVLDSEISNDHEIKSTKMHIDSAYTLGKQITIERVDCKLLLHQFEQIKKLFLKLY